MRFRLLSATAFVSILAGCATMSGGAGEKYQLDRLYFGRAIADTGFVSDSAWGGFLKDVVTPRFPAGFTASKSEGQWRSATGSIVREPGVVLDIVHPPSAADDAAIRAIIQEYRKRFNQEAVMRLTTTARVTFSD
jgi:hypothetical protein